MSASGGTVWARADRPARMLVEVSPTPSFRWVRHLPGPVVTPENDFTGKLRLHGLPPNEYLFYRVQFAD